MSYFSLTTCSVSIPVFVASVLHWLHHMGLCNYSNVFLKLPFPISRVHLCVRTVKSFPWLGKRTLWRRSPAASSTWRSPPKTTRRWCAVRASIWCPCHLCLSAANSPCSVSENNARYSEQRWNTRTHIYTHATLAELAAMDYLGYGHEAEEYNKSLTSKTNSFAAPA